MPEKPPLKIGIIGIGQLGSALAIALSRAGYPVQVTSRTETKHLTGQVKRLTRAGPFQIPSVAKLGDSPADGLMKEMEGGASVGTIESTANLNDVVILAVPHESIRKLVKVIGRYVADKIVIDATNADARGAPLKYGSSREIATFLYPARIVKAFNTVPAETITRKRRKRIGVPLASDDKKALAVVAGLVRDLGFAPVTVGELAEGKRFQPGSDVYRTELDDVALAKRLGLKR